MTHPSQRHVPRDPRPSSEALAALFEARRAAAAQVAMVSTSGTIAARLEEQRRQNHLGDLVDCAVAAAASHDTDSDPVRSST